MTLTLTPMQVKMAAVRAKGAGKQASQPRRPSAGVSPIAPAYDTANVRFRTSLDDGAWVELATTRGVRLPQRETPCTTGGMTHWLRKLGLSVEFYRQWTGYNSLAEWIKYNPGWSLRAFIGQALEESPEVGVAKEATNGN